jgi:hypothetical protein
MARRLLAFVWLTAFALAFALVPRTARADQGGARGLTVAVLAFDAEDAEEQADALTGALRSRIRVSKAWSLVETSQSLGMLTAALRCPSRPTPECQDRIADQIKVDRYVWGFLSKAPGRQVSAELHLYQRGKPDTVVKESYADNLKDANDDTLRGVAQRVLDRFGAKNVGVLVVHAKGEGSEVVVDGEVRVPLANGTARVELSPGGHSVELSSPGAAVEKKNVLVTAGTESSVEFGDGAAKTNGQPAAPEAEKPFPTKKVIGGVLLAAGLGLAVLSIERGLRYAEIQEHDGGRGLPPQGPPGGEPCSDNTAKQYCDLHKASQGVSTVAWVAGAAGAVAIGTGVYLLFLSSDGDEASTSTRKKMRVGPSFGARGGGLLLSGEF